MLVFEEQWTGIYIFFNFYFFSGCSRRRRWEGGPREVPVCVCALFMGHIGYISLKTKNIFFFFLSSRFSQKLETTKKRRRKKLRTQKLRRTSSLVPSLKKKKKTKKNFKKPLGICPLPESPWTCVVQQKKKKTITFCLCCLFVRLFLKTCINELHTGL